MECEGSPIELRSGSYRLSGIPFGVGAERLQRDAATAGLPDTGAR